ncbi:hypothetical protein ACFQX7_15180 [Luedemannella flava]
MQSEIRDRLTGELADSGPPPLGSLVTDAVAAGTRLRRRRLAALASGATALVIAASAGVIATLTAGPAPTTVPQFGAAAGPSAAEKTVEPSASAPALVIPPGHKATSGQAVVAVLKTLVPDGRISEIDFYDVPGTASGMFVLDDGHGKATITAGVSNQPLSYTDGEPAPGELTCPPDGKGFTCTVSDLPGGARLRVATMGPYGCPDTKCSLKDVRIELMRADGVVVMIESYSGPFGHGRGATRPDTILSVTRMTAMAKDPRWSLTMPAPSSTSPTR